MACPKRDYISIYMTFVTNNPLFVNWWYISILFRSVPTLVTSVLLVLVPRPRREGGGKYQYYPV